MEMPAWLIILMSVYLRCDFSRALLYILEPRFVRAERERNVKAYPFLRELVDAKKATVTLRDGTVFYNATFEGYAQKMRKRFYYMYIQSKQKKHHRQQRSMK